MLEAMEEFHEFAVERARFQVLPSTEGGGQLWQWGGRGRAHISSLLLQTIVWDLYDSLEGVQDPSSLQIAIMSFINALISFKAGEVGTWPCRGL